MTASQPVIHLLVGPNGAGKSSIFRHILQPSLLGLPFINADEIAHARWPGAEVEHSYEAARIAAQERLRHVDERASFVTETVFSHESKLEFIEAVRALGYHVTLHAVVVPVELSVARVAARVRHGGHEVPEDKIRQRFDRLWPLVRAAISVVNEATIYDNSGRAPVVLAEFTHGVLSWRPGTAPPSWLPASLSELVDGDT